MQTDDDRTLSPQERKLRAHERREVISKKYRDALGDYNDEERAARDGYLLSKNARSTPQTARRQGMLSRLSGTVFGAGFINLNEVFGVIGAFNKGLQEFVTAPSPAISTAMPGKSAPAIDPRHVYEDDTHVYDTTFVSQTTARELEREIEIISAKMRELKAAENPQIREDIALKIELLAEEFQMHQHPRTLLYVHNINRILEMEERLNPQSHPRTAEICIVRLKAEIGDPRGVKRAVGDVYNEDPAEVQLNHNEKTAVAAARPTFDLR